MNKDLEQDLIIAAAAFTKNEKRCISAGDHNFFEYWLSAETELIMTLRDVIVRHKNKHTFEEMIMISLLVGQAARDIMNDLHRLDKENEE